MNISHKKYLFSILFTLVIYVFSFSVLMFSDPLQIFHKPWLRDAYYLRELRVQAAGIINNEDLDSVILGTSMAANFSAAEASSIWGEKFVNISLDGSSIAERAVVLNYALKKKNIRSVIFTVDEFGSEKFSETNNSFTSLNFGYLYDDDQINDLRIYSNLKYLKYVPCGYIGVSCDTNESLNSLTYWYSNRFGGIENWFKNSNDAQVRRAFGAVKTDINSIENNKIEILDKKFIDEAALNDRLKFESYILKYVKANPGTNFYLIFPPYSTLYNSLLKKAHINQYSVYVERIRYIAALSKFHNNMYVYSFSNEEFTNHISNYKDLQHYRPELNSFILHKMHAQEFLLTTDNVGAYIDRFSKKNDVYDPMILSSKIICFLDKKNINHCE